MADALGGSDKIVSADGSVSAVPQQLVSGAAPGFAHLQIVCAPGETQLLPYSAGRIFAAVQNPAASGKSVLLSVGEVFAAANVYTTELAAGDYWEMPQEIVTTAIHVWNPNVVNVTLEVTEGDLG